MINWPEKPGNIRPYFLRSECGNWHIARFAMRHGTKVKMRYRLFERVGGKWKPRPEPLSSFESADKAKEQAK